MIPLRDHNPSYRKPLITIGLVALNFYIFFKELTAPSLTQFISRYGLIPAALDFSRLDTFTPLFSSMFLHGGWFHIISNMWFLWIFGDNVEDRLGHSRYLIFYLLAGVIAGLTQYFVDPVSRIPMIGASGAVAGVLGAYLIYFPRQRIDTLVPIFLFIEIIPLPAVIMIGYWFATQLFAGIGSLAVQTAASAGIAFFAHIGGFIAGMLMAGMAPRRQKIET